MKYLANALGKRGITVNAVSPGGVVTPANAHILESEAQLGGGLLGRARRAGEIVRYVDQRNGVTDHDGRGGCGDGRGGRQIHEHLLCVQDVRHGQ